MGEVEPREASRVEAGGETPTEDATYEKSDVGKIYDSPNIAQDAQSEAEKALSAQIDFILFGQNSGESWEWLRDMRTVQSSPTKSTCYNAGNCRSRRGVSARLSTQTGARPSLRTRRSLDTATRKSFKGCVAERETGWQWL